MAKSKPIGVRFDLDLLQMFKDDKVAETPQAALNYLTEFYRTNRERIDFKAMFENSSLFKNAKHTDERETETLNKAFKKTFKPKKETDPNKGLSKGEILRRLRENTNL